MLCFCLLRCLEKVSGFCTLLSKTPTLSQGMTGSKERKRRHRNAVPPPSIQSPRLSQVLDFFPQTFRSGFRILRSIDGRARNSNRRTGGFDPFDPLCVDASRNRKWNLSFPAHFQQLLDRVPSLRLL